MSYSKNPEIIALNSPTIKEAINILFPSLIFSFLLSSLYFGSLTKKLAKNIKVVIIYGRIDPHPQPIIFPINPNARTIIIGISFAPTATTIAKLAGDTDCPSPMQDTIKAIIYNTMYFLDIALVNILFFLLVSSFVLLCLSS